MNSPDCQHKLSTKLGMAANVGHAAAIRALSPQRCAAQRQDSAGGFGPTGPIESKYRRGAQLGQPGQFGMAMLAEPIAVGRSARGRRALSRAA